MRVAYITSGAAGMYCGSCMNANTLASAMIDQGHEVALVPTYTPMRIDEESVAGDRMFFGALNVYLQQKYPLFRHTPRFVAWLLDRPALLSRLARWSGKADTSDIGALTLSMLQGESGAQAQELDRLVDWLATEFKPDVVHLSFAFFLGFVRRLKERLNVPVVCSVQGEEIMLDEIPETYRDAIVEEMRQRARDIDLVIAPCSVYAEAMAELLGLPSSRMAVSHLGIKAEDYLRAPLREPEHPDRPLALGYLARVCPEKGLHILLEAFQLLARDFDVSRLRLRVAGYLSPRDAEYFEQCRAWVRAWGLEDRVDFVGEVDRTEKVDFLASLDILSVPTPYREPKALFLLEAMASGTPVVQPDHGTFPELIETTGGGLTVPPNDPAALAAGIRTLIEDPARRVRLAARGREGVLREFTATAAASRVLSAYGRLTNASPRVAVAS